MISQPEKTPQRHRHSSESYDEKCERRHETRENLRRRNNVTTCRSIGKHNKKEAEEQSQSPRQREFLRRRNLVTEEGKKPRKPLPGAQDPLGQTNATHFPQDPSSLVHLSLFQKLTQSAVSFQHPWSCCVFPHAHHQLGLSTPLRLGSLCSCTVSSENTPSKGISTDTQGTQTLTNSSAKTKDSSQQTDCGIAVLNKEIVQLSNYLKEALHRELLLKQKMVILQELFSTLLQASEKSWQGQLNEEKLKCKLRALENQLQACTQSYSKERVKKILIEMEDQKQTYEQKAKEALQKMLEDKLQVEQQLQNSQRSLAVTKEDCALWKEHYNTLKAEWTEMTKAHTELKNNLHILQSKLQVYTQNEQLHLALRNLENEHAELRLRISVLQEDNKLKAEHISVIEGKLQKEQNQKITLEATISHLHTLLQNQTNEQKTPEAMVQKKDQVLTSQTPPLTPATGKQNAPLEHPEEEGEESLKDEMQKRTSQLTAKENECTELRLELEALSDEYRSCLTKLRQCRDELNQFQSKWPKRQQGNWIPLLVVAIAMAIAAFLANYVP
ncbi:TRAF3-interacting JNK-activating modulator [Struthio camelus australis]|uniref:TRAF3-interacting JNK-activating modulator n=1 Tax=Struthio camelus australis TaxID=441894 RepID=A0A093HK68_STRCA|nr:TRAF3-interacting JNK-activating modulator [Struthio camelus australis]